MGCCNGKHELHYRNLAGEMVSYDSSQDFPTRDDEAAYIAGFDESYMQPRDVMYVIDSKWLKKWHSYIEGSCKRSKVGKIDNNELYSNTVTLRSGLVLKHDYHPVCREVWEYYFTHHGGGPVIYFYVPSGFTDEEYRSGEWLHGCDLSVVCDVIYPVPKKTKAPYQLAVSKSSTHLGEKRNYQPVQNKTDEELKNEIAAGNTELIALGMIQDHARKKFTKANELEEHIDKHEGDVLAGEVTEDQGDEKIKSAKLREEEARRREAEVSSRHLMDGFATKVQGRWRSKLAQRRVDALLAEQQRLREEGAALRVQSAIRIRKAKARVAALRLEKREKKGAMVFQALWRGKVGRKKAMCAKQAACLINRFVRGSLARMHFRLALRTHHPHVLVIRLRNAWDINIGDINTSDAYVRVTNLERMHAHAKATAREPFSCPVDIDVKLRVASQYKSHIKMATLTPEWDEDAVLPAVQWDSTLVLSMYDADLVESDDLLGQNSVHVNEIGQLYTGKSISYENTAIGDYVYPVYDSSGKALVTSGDGQMKGKGHFSFSIRLSSLAYSMSGWLQKDMSLYLHKSFYNRWVVLHDFAIHYYEDPYHMNVCKGTLLCKDVTALSVKEDHFTLHCAHEKDSWHFAFETHPEHAAYNQMWLRKLIRSCPNVRDPASMALIGLPRALWDERSVDHITHGTAPTLNIAQSGHYDTSFENLRRKSTV